MKRLAAPALVVFVSATLGFAQQRAIVTGGSDTDPFSIKRGSSFSASKPVRSDTRPIPGAKGSTGEIAREIAEALEIVRNNFVAGEMLDFNAITKSALESALRTLDPHSSYFDPTEFKDLLNEEDSEYSGIGATVINFRHGGHLDTYVASTSPGSPAAGKLKFGDRIVEVNDDDMAERSADEVSDSVRGDNGTRVKLLVERAATGQLETIEIRRSMVARPSIRDAFVLPGNVGYVAMTEGFNSTTANELTAALKQLHRLGAASLVIDLRDNPGGILEQAVKVAEKFLPAGAVIVSQRGRSRADNRVWRSANRFPETMPLVLLVNENTASASEIFAGALQDHDRAFIVGQRTFGKGLVQSVYDTPYGSGLTLTTARYFTPSGRLIQRDYSSGAIYDYYNHRTDITKQAEARTSGNRPVFGGDGITPDESIGPKELSQNENNLLDALFFFSRDVVYKREATDITVPAAFVGGPAAGAHVNDKLTADFLAFVRKSSPDITATDLSSESGFIAERLSYFMTLAAKGDEAANRVLLASDPQVQRAVAELPRAKDLALASVSPRNRTVH